jgi:hypothetical protein
MNPPKIRLGHSSMFLVHVGSSLVSVQGNDVLSLHKKEPQRESKPTLFTLCTTVNSTYEHLPKKDLTKAKIKIFYLEITLCLYSSYHTSLLPSPPPPSLIFFLWCCPHQPTLQPTATAAVATTAAVNYQVVVAPLESTVLFLSVVCHPLSIIHSCIVHRPHTTTLPLLFSLQSPPYFVCSCHTVQCLL